MANRFICGFDDYDATGMAYEWAVQGSYGPPAIAAGMTGNCVQMSSNVNTPKGMRITAIPEGGASVFVGFRFKLTSFSGFATDSAIFSCGDTTRTHLLLVLQTDGTLSFYRTYEPYGGPTFTTNGATLLGTTTYALVANVEYYIELEITIHNSAGVANIYINGSPTAALTVTGADTQNLGTAKVTWVGWCGPFVTSVGSIYVDDIYVNDTTGALNNGLEGDVRVYSHFPVTPAGNSSQWDRSTGADQWATVDENPQSTADYNSTAVLNELDTLNLEAFKDAGSTICAVQVNLLAQKTQSGTCGMVPVIRVNSTDYPHATTHYLSASWVIERTSYDQQPDATDWNETDFNAMEVGYKKTA